MPAQVPRLHLASPYVLMAHERRRRQRLELRALHREQGIEVERSLFRAKFSLSGIPTRHLQAPSRIGSHCRRRRSQWLPLVLEHRREIGPADPGM